jgi:hypothetical protein
LRGWDGLIAMPPLGRHCCRMRALLILIVLLAWAACLLGAVGLTTYLVTAAAGVLRGRQRSGGRSPTSPPQGAVPALVVFAGVMAVAAAALAGVVLWGRTPGSWASALAWALLPSWAALSAAITAVVLRRRGRVPAPAPELRTG